MFCFEVAGGRMSFTGILSKSMLGIKSLLVLDDMVSYCVVVALAVVSSKRVQEINAGV